MEIMSLEFSYRSKTYYALIRTKIINREKQYHITVMNGELERLLYGHHIIAPKRNSFLHVANEDIPVPEVIELKQCIIEALWRYLGINQEVDNEANFVNSF